MSFLRRAAREEDNFSDEEESEDLYRAMYKKIARDFLHKEDFVNILRRLISEIAIYEEIETIIQKVNLRDDQEAIRQAYLYRDGRASYNDLINMDE